MPYSERFAYLFGRYAGKTYTALEKEEFLLYLREGSHDEQLKNLLDQEWDTPFKLADPGKEKAADIYRYILENSPPIQQSLQKKKLHFTRTTWFRSVAACLILSAGLYLWKKQVHTIPVTQVAAVNNDIAPGTNKAVLTLADGSTILLDSAADGGLAKQGNTRVIKLNGMITYSSTAQTTETAAPLMNTISTARGNQYQLVLADGTRVWLNAASSLRFPASFAGKERLVEVTGEAYFEVAENAKMPFRVQVPGGEINVLGTRFNVNAYQDEEGVKTTLIEGVVTVKKQQNIRRLQPGEQATFTQNGDDKIHTNKNADTYMDIAWKDGFFLFNNSDIHTLMRQVSRWYDVEVSFDGIIQEDGFTGKVSRSVPLSKLLHVLEQYDIHFKRNGNKITVLRNK